MQCAPYTRDIKIPFKLLHVVLSVALMHERLSRGFCWYKMIYFINFIKDKWRSYTRMIIGLPQFQKIKQMHWYATFYTNNFLSCLLEEHYLWFLTYKVRNYFLPYLSEDKTVTMESISSNWPIDMQHFTTITFSPKSGKKVFSFLLIRGGDNDDGEHFIKQNHWFATFWTINFELFLTYQGRKYFIPYLSGKECFAS